MVKWSTPLTLMATVKDTTDQGGEMERNYKMKALQGRTDWRPKEVDYLRFKITQSRSTTNMNISTHKSERQVLMQYMESCPQMVYIIKNCNL